MSSQQVMTSEAFWRTYKPAFARAKGKDGEWLTAVGCTDAQKSFERILRQDGWEGHIEYMLISDMTKEQKRHLIGDRYSVAEAKELMPFQAITGETSWHE